MVDREPGYRPRRAFVDPRTADDPAAAASPAEEPGPNRPAADGEQRAVPEESVGGTEEARTVRPLPGTAAAAQRVEAEPEDLDLDLDDEHRPGFLGRRGRLALLISAMAAVVAVGIALIYAVSSVGNPSTTAPSASLPSASGSTSAQSTDPRTLLSDDQLLTPAAAEQIDGRRTWQVAQTERPAGAEGPLPACSSSTPAEGEPTAQQEVVRLLSSSGKAAPSALHHAAAYATPEDAAQAYAATARTFGGCAAPGSYIVSGAGVSTLGDQSTGLVVNVVADGKTTLHSIVLSRTGRVLNVLDAAQEGRQPSVIGVARALAAVTTAQCQPAGGGCAARPTVKAAPPPLGGDVPGFLATGDLPPAGKADESWVATPAEPPNENFLGSQCETVNWTRVDAATASTRVYLVASSTKFGLNDIVATMKSEQAARDLVAKIKADLQSCSKRKLTATVSDPAPVQGVGARGSTVTGWTVEVSQKSTTGTQRYRVGIVSSGRKVAYTFLNPLPGGYDLSSSEWNLVSVRAGQRMTQVP